MTYLEKAKEKMNTTQDPSVAVALSYLIHIAEIIGEKFDFDGYCECGWQKQEEDEMCYICSVKKMLESLKEKTSPRY